jgi:predicted Rossmann fold flavoprotein
VIHDIAVVGAGPAGLIAAGRAREVFRTGFDRSPSILVLDGNSGPGRKLLLTGGGRCNLTNLQSDVQHLASRYGREGRALISPFSRFSPHDCIELFSRLGLETKVEAESRVFPCDDSAASVLAALLSYCEGPEVEFRYGETIAGIESAEPDGRPRTYHLESRRGHRFEARTLIMATGGFARPDTGSDGSGFELLTSLGHRINRPDAMLVPLAVREKAVTSLMGVSLQDAGIRVLLSPPSSDHGSAKSGGLRPADERVLEKRRGKLLFTHFGLSGPAILNLSGRIGELEQEYAAERSRGYRLIIEINPSPDLGEEETDRLIRDRCAANPKKRLRNALEDLFPSRYSPVRDDAVAAILEGRAGELTREDRRILVRAAKGIRLTFARRMSPEDAIVARGGVPIDQVDFRRMESKTNPGLYIIGDMLDINRPSGGYSLQLCWASGWVAGEAAVQFLRG